MEWVGLLLKLLDPLDCDSNQLGCGLVEEGNTRSSKKFFHKHDGQNDYDDTNDKVNDGGKNQFFIR